MVALAAGSAHASDADTSPMVTIDEGALRGAAMTRLPGTIAFRDIPYAAPPLGTLRWRPPEPATPWRGVRDASALGPACPQQDWLNRLIRANVQALGRNPADAEVYTTTSEDCLNLNVFTPNLHPAALQPVMVYIHGGSGVVGEATDQGSLLTKNSVVVVSLNYRLGILGFLAHPALTRESPHQASGNYGLLDQIAALRWIRHNIARFGGDPNRVTIFGQSSGAYFAGVLMTTPLARGLFQRVILESGTPYGTIDRVREKNGTVGPPEKLGLALAKQFGATNPATALATLRSIPAARFVAVESKNSPYQVALDGWSVPEQPQTVFFEGRQLNVPTIVGANAGEMRNLWHLLPDTSERAFRSYVNDNYAPLQQSVLHLYDPPASPDSTAAFIRALTDIEFIGAARVCAEQMSRVTKNAYLYEVTWNYSSAAGRQLGAFHGIELTLLFDAPHAARGAAGDALAAATRGYWTRFAATGDPNGNGLPTWPAYTSAVPGYLTIAAPPRAATDLKPQAFAIAKRLFSN